MPHRLPILSSLNNSFVRFLGVGLFSEILYLVLFAVSLYFKITSNLAVILAGSFCIILNSYLHARVSFKKRFRIKFILVYFLIQSICMLASYFFSIILIHVSVSPAQIGVATMLLWALLSYALCFTFLGKRKLVIN